MRTNYNRRTIIKRGLGSMAGVSLLGLAACNDTPVTTAATQGNTAALQMLFWGTTTRDKDTKQAISSFQAKNADTSISSSYTTFANYWGALDSRIAAGKIPALIQMDMAYLAKYARQQLMFDLSQMVYNQTIDLSDFDPLILDNSKANNALYGIPLGGNYQSMIYDQTLLKSIGVTVLPQDFTWETFATYAAAIANELGPTIYGCGDSSSDIATFEIWMRQRKNGAEMYTPDGQLAYPQQDVEDWFAYWAQMRASRGCVSAAIQNTTLKGGPLSAPITQGKAVFGTPHSNEFESYQAANHHSLALHPIPNGPAAGLFFKPSLLICISATTPYVQEAANFINFMINDPDGIKALGTERGIPGSQKAQALLGINFTQAQQQEVAFTKNVSSGSNTRLKEVLDPPKASLVTPILQKISLDIAFNRTSVKAGAATFYQMAQQALNS